MIHLLLIETDKAAQEAFLQWVEKASQPYRYTIVETMTAAKEVAAVDLILAGEWGDDIRELAEKTPFIIMARPGEEKAILQAGAWDYIIKTGDYCQLLPLTIANTLQRKRLTGRVQRLQMDCNEALRESEQKFRGIVEQARDGISLVDETGVVIEWNESIERITGLPVQAVLGHPMWDVQFWMASPEQQTPETYQLLQKTIRQLLQTGQAPWLNQLIEREYIHPDGSKRRIQGVVFPIKTDKGFMLGSISRDVTAYYQTAQELRESEERFSHVVASISDHIYVTEITEDEVRLNHYISPHVEVLTGYAQARFEADWSFWSKQVIHPQDQPAARAQLEQLIQGHSHEAEYRLIRADGEIIWVRDSAQVEYLGDRKIIYGVVSDITHRKEAEAGLAHRLKFEHLVSAIAARLIHALTPADLTRELSRAMRVIGDFLDMDRSYVFLFGDEPPHISAVYHWHRPGFNSLRHLQGLELTPFRWIMQQWQGKKSVYVPDTADIPPEAAAEKEVWLQEGVQTLITVPLLYQEKVIGVIGLDCIRHPKSLSEADIELIQTIGQMITNLLQRQRAELALAEEKAQLAQRVADRTAELRTANAELARAARLKDEFLASMSHELRTPLNAILGMAEILREEIYGDLTEKQQASIHTVEESGQHLLALINDILDLSKIEAGQFDLEITPISATSVCRSSLNFVQQMAFKKNIRLTSTLDQQVNIIHADARRFKQILVNLLSNAVKFTPAGGKIGLEMIGDETERIIRFIVWDTGIGIAQKDMARLFQPFVQLDSALSRQYEGTGLGLSLVYRLVDMHGGSIRVESEPGRGSRFTVSLPWPAETGLPPVDKEKTPPSLEMEGSAIILLAEDNLSNRIMVRDFLQARNFEVATAQDGYEVLLYIQEEERPDIILMDIQMPGMNGLEAIQQIRADESLPHIPIIALTALAMPGDRERCLNAGADEYMSKPIRLRKLLELIHRQLAAHSPPET